MNGATTVQIPAQRGPATDPVTAPPPELARIRWWRISAASAG